MFIFSLLALTAVTYACDTLGGVCVNENCTTFTNKLGTQGASPFSGSVAFDNDTVDLIIKINYNDANFNDNYLSGIVTGENSASCLSLALMQYTDNSFSYYIPSSYAIKYSNDTTSSNRTYSFVIPSKDFVAQLQPILNGSYIAFTGYYSFQFSIGTLLQLELQFYFTAQISTTTTQDLSTSFGSLSTRSDLGTASLAIQSALAFCVDSACTNTSDTASLYLNDQVWLKHSLTTSGASYYIINPVIYFTGDKLYKQAQIEQSKTNTLGYSLYLVTISIAWTNVSISVQGTLSSTAGSRFLNEDLQRILATAQGTTSTSTTSVSCIQVSATDSSCYSCDTTCTNVNNSPISGQNCPCPCGDCSSGLLIAYLTLSLLLIFMY